MRVVIVLFAHESFHWVFLDETTLVSGPPFPPLRFVVVLSLGPRTAAAGAMESLARTTKVSYPVDCGKPALSRIFLNHRLPGNGWFG